jgi:hypothetical protein
VKRVALVLAALVGVAAADSVVPPAGWKLDESFSRQLTRNAQGTSYFGPIPTTSIKVEAFTATNVGLYVARAEATVTATQRDAAATRALFEFVDGARRQGSAQIESSSQRVDPTAKLLEANIVWRDNAGIRQIARTVVTGDATHLVAHHGECVLPLDVAKDIEAACTKALTTLDEGIPADQRVLLAIVDAPAETELPPIPVATTEPTARPRMTDQPRLGDGAGRTSMPPMTIAPAKRPLDRRPFYLGAGIVVLAALFWWNRKARDRFDREEAPAPTTTTPETSSGDDDADDLQAAARGAAPKDES